MQTWALTHPHYFVSLQPLMSRGKRILLLVVLLFPGLLYFFFELTEANFRKMPFFGPKILDQKGDTVYYAAPLNGFLKERNQTAVIDTNEFPVFLLGFIHDKFRSDGYKLQGLLDFTQFNPEKLEYVNLLLVSAFDSVQPSRKEELKIKNKHVQELYCNQEKFDSLNALFFKAKPVHVFPYFFVLLDKNRNIRGYYDPTYVSEMKRMIQEFEHLKLRDEKARMLEKRKFRDKDNKELGKEE